MRSGLSKLGSSRRLLEVRRRQEVDQPAHLQQRLDVVVIGAVGDRGLGRVDLRAAEFLGRHRLVRHRLHHVRAGDEHVARVAHHEDEVGHRRRIDVAAGAGPHDQRNLRDDAGGQHVALEHLAIAAERRDALLDAGAAGVEKADDRGAVLDRHVLDLGDLLRMRFAKGAAEDREILGENIDGAAVDRAPAGHHPVARNLGRLHAEIVAAVLDEHVELLEEVVVEQEFDTLARGELALGVLRGDALLAAAQASAGATGVEMGENVLHGASWLQDPWSASGLSRRAPRRNGAGVRHSHDGLSPDGPRGTGRRRSDPAGRRTPSSAGSPRRPSNGSRGQTEILGRGSNVFKSLRRVFRALATPELASGPGSVSAHAGIARRRRAPKDARLSTSFGGMAIRENVDALRTPRADGPQIPGRGFNVSKALRRVFRAIATPKERMGAEPVRLRAVIARRRRASKDARLSTGFGGMAIRESIGAWVSLHRLRRPSNRLATTDRTFPGADSMFSRACGRFSGRSQRPSRGAATRISS